MLSLAAEPPTDTAVSTATSALHFQYFLREFILIEARYHTGRSHALRQRPLRRRRKRPEFPLTQRRSFVRSCSTIMFVFASLLR